MITKIYNKIGRVMLGAAFFALYSSLFTSCTSGDQDFPDYDYQTVYFAKQYPVRTVELGNDDYVDLTLDNQHKINIKATMGGAYDNRRNITVNIAIDPSLCDGAKFKDTGEEVVVMPTSYYQLAAQTITIPAGQISAGVEVQLTDAFFADPLSVTRHYVIPLRMVSATGVDSVLSNKNYVLYAVKYINRYAANYVYAGTNNVLNMSTVDLNCVSLSYGAKDASGKEHPCLITLHFGNDGHCTMTTDSEGFTVEGTGRFVEADETQLLGARHPDTMYLNFTVTNEALGIRTSEQMVLHVQTRGVVPESFEIEN